ncbi:MAG: periplasmic protein TonB [Acetobacteraceae bacterium]|nr:periplasmic protein TonB [Acetobacteraceae bacterium]
MGHHTISASGPEVRRRRRPPEATRRNRLLLIAATLSVSIHLIAALLIVMLSRSPPKAGAAAEQGTVELLMVEKKGAQPSQAGQPQEATPAPAPPEPAQATKTEEKTDEPAKQAAKAPPPPSEQGDEPAPPPAEQARPPPPASKDETPTKQTEAQPTAPPSQQGPVFDLAGTDSESNAIVLGGQVLPAMKDDRFRNRPPPYPVEAEVRGEHGSVLVMIHVSQDGTAASVDVVESSGHSVLDQAAVTAVRKWHFRPALRDGQSVPFDMPFRFVFEPY